MNSHQMFNLWLLLTIIPTLIAAIIGALIVKSPQGKKEEKRK